ncbi:MAG: hypothetical protein NZ823_06355 [Blastocatellia bacterium]|nr:hypothetical protein [Blastocatellia bacterium]MDW8224256.1 hypothetical protein [Gemmatales bacterium]
MLQSCSLPHMKPTSTNPPEHIDRAVELAYFIHGRKGIALGVVQEALSSLDRMLGRQDKTRRNYKHLLGFLKWEQRARPMRTTVKLTPAQMLQWLVYEKSESRERDTEYPDSLSPPTEEDMVLRYIKHLVQLTVKRNSFYVALGIGRLLYDYSTHEVRLMYDVLTQSDPARMKDIPYMRKQKMMLIDKIRERFGRMLQPVTTVHGEKRFEVQPSTQWLINLVNECLRRFTPWETACVVQGRFDPTFIPGLYFSGTNPADEDSFEITRIHTVLDPECFRHLVSGLSQFAKGLPADSPDKHCEYGPPDKRLAVPQFRHVASGPPRSDRFDPPKMEPEDYLQLQRHREAQARRRSVYAAGMLRLYVDDVQVTTFDPRRTNSVYLDIEPEANLIEVRGEDAEGELPLATLMVCCDEIPPGGYFRDWIVLEGGQKVTIQLTPIRNASGDIERALAQVRYVETKISRAILWQAQHAWAGFLRACGWPVGRMSDQIKSFKRPHPHTPLSTCSWMSRVSVALVLAATVVMLIWIQRQRAPVNLPEPPRAAVPQPPEPTPSPPPAPSPVSPEAPQPIAQAIWSRDRETIAQAISIAPTRAGVSRVALSPKQTTLLIRLSQYDEESQPYSRYRITLIASGERLWQQTLAAPRDGLTDGEHVLKLILFPTRLPNGDTYQLLIRAQSGQGWQSLGQVLLQRR